MDRLDADRIVLAVFDLGSFARAAERFGVSAGQASKLVARREADLGVQLFTRSTRALSPTEAGIDYVARMRKVIEEVDAIDAAVQSRTGRPSGRLRLAAPLTFGVGRLNEALVEFMRAQPEILLDVVYSDGLANLVDDGFDAAIRIGAPGDADLIARKLCDIRITLGASPDYLARHGTPEHPGELQDHACLIDTNFPDPLNWRFETTSGPLRVPVKARARMRNAEACVRMAEAGLGIARVPSFVAGPAFQRRALVPLLTEVEDRKVTLYVVYPSARHLPLKTRALIDHLSAAFKGIPEWETGWAE